MFFSSGKIDDVFHRVVCYLCCAYIQSLWAFFTYFADEMSEKFSNP